MNTPMYLLSVFLGVVLTVHLAMNGAVGAALNNPRVGNALFWVIGAVTAVIIGLTLVATVVSDMAGGRSCSRLA